MNDEQSREAHHLAFLIAEGRIRALALLHWRGIFTAAAAALLYLLAGLLAAPLLPARPWVRWAFWCGLPALGAAAYFWSALRLRSRYRSAEQIALLIQRRMPQLKDAPINAVQLESELSTDTSFSRSLIRAYLAHAARATAGADVLLVDGEVRVLRAMTAALAAFLLALILVLAAPGRLTSGLVVLTAGSRPGPSAASAGGALAVSDLEVTYDYPAYAGQAQRRVGGSDGALRALKGTQVTLRGRLSPEVAEGRLVLNERRDVPLETGPGGRFSARFPLMEDGAYRIEGARDKQRLAGAGRPMWAVPDEAPEAHIIHAVPAAGASGVVELEPGQTLEIAYRCRDDYGLGQMFLECERDGGAQRFLLPAAAAGEPEVTDSYRWAPEAQSYGFGNEMALRIVARDNDSISGPKEGRSTALTVRLVTGEIRHRRLVGEIEALRRVMVWLLADRLVPRSGAAVAGGDRMRYVVRLHELNNRVVQLGLGILSRMDADPLADRTLYDALGDMTDRRATELQPVAAGRRRLLDSASAADAVQALAEALGVAIAESVPPLEKDVVSLDDLLQLEHMRAAQRLAERLAEMNKRVQELLRQAREGGLDPQRLRELKGLTAAMKGMMDDLAARMAQTAREVEREFLNPDALQMVDRRGEMKQALDRMLDQAQQGDMEKALAEAGRMGEQLGRMMAGMQQGGRRVAQARFGGASQALQGLRSDLEKIVRDQQDLHRRTQAADAQLRGDVEKSMADEMKAIFEKQIARAREVGARMDKLQQGLPRAGAPPAAARAARLAGDHIEQSRPSLGALLRDLEEGQLDGAQGSASELAERLKASEAALKGRPELSDKAQAGGAAAEAAAAIRDDLAELKCRIDDAGGRQALQQMPRQLEGMASRQGDVEGNLREAAAKMGKSPVPGGSGIQETLQGAAGDMHEARRSLEGGQTGPGGRHQQAALRKLGGAMEQTSEALQQMAQNMQGRPALRRTGPPSPEGMGGPATDEVKIPDPASYRVPEAFRADITRALRDGLPEAHRPLNEKYYEELVK